MTGISAELGQVDTVSFPIERGADYASIAALLLVGDRLGLLPGLEAGDPVTVAELAQAASLSEEVVANYLEALSVAGVVGEVAGRTGTFQVVPEFATIRYEAGYASWNLNANRPFIENARLFVESPAEARKAYQRDGREVAISSRWIGSLGFYSLALSTILAANPRKVVDLGAGAGRLLIEILQKCPDATAVALDMDEPSCQEAVLAAKRAMVGDRMTVTCRSIESLAEDSADLVGADVIHAGFVMHDLMPDAEDIAQEVMRRSRESLNSGGFLAITDAVPYARAQRERGFSAAMTYFHKQFMGRRLLTEDEWTEKLLAAGFDGVEVLQHRLPSGRLYVARKN